MSCGVYSDCPWCTSLPPLRSIFAAFDYSLRQHERRGTVSGLVSQSSAAPTLRCPPSYTTRVQADAGGCFDAIRAEPGRYVLRRGSERCCAAAARRARTTFLATNSKPRFANFVAEAALGPARRPSALTWSCTMSKSRRFSRGPRSLGCWQMQGAQRTLGVRRGKCACP